MECKIKNVLTPLLACGTAILTFTGCSEGPEDALKNYFSAARNGNTEEALKYRASHDSSEYSPEMIKFLYSKPKILNVEHINLDGERAIVEFQNEFINGDTIWICQLLKCDGRWVITGFSDRKKNDD